MDHKSQKSEQILTKTYAEDNRGLSQLLTKQDNLILNKTIFPQNNIKINMRKPNLITKLIIYLNNLSSKTTIQKQLLAQERAINIVFIQKSNKLIEKN